MISTPGHPAILRPSTAPNALDCWETLVLSYGAGSKAPNRSIIIASLIGSLDRYPICYRIASVGVTISTHLSTGGQCNVRWVALESGQLELIPWPPKCFPADMQLMDTRIGRRAIVTAQVINWAAIIIGMALILTVIGASIMECLANRH